VSNRTSESLLGAVVATLEADNNLVSEVPAANIKRCDYEDFEKIAGELLLSPQKSVVVARDSGAFSGPGEIYERTISFSVYLFVDYPESERMRSAGDAETSGAWDIIELIHNALINSELGLTSDKCTPIVPVSEEMVGDLVDEAGNSVGVSVYRCRYQTSVSWGE